MKNKASRKNHLLQELRQKAESRINNLKTGEDIDFTSIHEVIHELNVHQVELTMQKDELEAKQRDLEKSRNEYFRLF
ncbi:MAG: histidine kinase, partial [Desulfonatronovibrio sp. MSAO_Bac4]